MPPIVAAAGIAATASIVGSKLQINSQRDASRIEERSTNAALTDAREERSYDRMTAEEQRKYDRMTSEEQRAYDRARYADETKFDRTRYFDERDYDRGVYADERDYSRGVYADERDYGRAFQEDERNYGRGQFANYLQRLEPFSKAGAGAVNRLASSVGRAMPATVPTMGGGQLVKIQAPNGQVREVPAQHAEHYISRGGKQVG